MIKGQNGFPEGELRQAKIGSFGLHTFDNQGNLYFDPGGGRIWKITSEGQIVSVLGTGVKGYKDGAAHEAQLSFSSDATFDSNTKFIPTGVWHEEQKN